MLSGHPSSSCCVGCGAGSGTPCCFWLLRRSLRLRAAVAYCVSLTEGCILYCTHAKCPMRMPILAWLILNPEKSKHKTPSNHKVRTLIWSANTIVRKLVSEFSRALPPRWYCLRKIPMEGGSQVDCTPAPRMHFCARMPGTHEKFYRRTQCPPGSSLKFAIALSPLHSRDMSIWVLQVAFCTASFRKNVAHITLGITRFSAICQRPWHEDAVVLIKTKVRKSFSKTCRYSKCLDWSSSQ